MRNGKLKREDAAHILDTLLASGHVEDAGDSWIDFDEVFQKLFTEYHPAVIHEIVKAVGANTLTDALMSRLYGDEGDAG